MTAVTSILPAWSVQGRSKTNAADAPHISAVQKIYKTGENN